MIFVLGEFGNILVLYKMLNGVYCGWWIFSENFRYCFKLFYINIKKNNEVGCFIVINIIILILRKERVFVKDVLYFFFYDSCLICFINYIIVVNIFI